MPPYTTDSQSHCCDGPSSPSSKRSPHRSLHPPSSRPLHHKQDHDEPKKATSSNNKTETTSRDGLLQHAAMELEAMRCRPPPQKKRGDSNNSISTNGSISNNISNNNEVERSFPPACLHLLHSLPGNRRCHDCHNGSASWASVSYGIILCLQCSGKHRGLGVNCSFIKSLTLDSWKRKEILCMLEGGNEQLTLFFDRHQMGGTTDGGAGGNVTRSSNVGVVARYRTKAASFYRQHLMIHAKQLAEGGIYEGREASRRSSSSKQQRKSTNKSSSGKCRKKSREQQLTQQLPTVTEKESVEPPCGAVGA
mmetsp:Transcript_16075/g.34718  ORF Transcript_16075/g.34718 Transcript_16075/m.34718 type:complete len:307 (+) Transcript_16075:478-1398(+)